MNCIKCGQQVSETARFCPGCGTPVGGSAPTSTTRGRLIPVLGVVAVLVIAAAALWFIKRPQPGTSAAAPQTQPTGGDSPKIAPAQISGFDWSGLSPDQLQSARAALDEAISKEERSRAGTSSAAPAVGKSTP